MPLLVWLTDSEIKAVDGVVAQVSDGVEHVRGVLEDVGSAGLPIHQEPLLPDLHIEPVHGDAQLGGHLGRSERARVMGPSAARLGHRNAGGAPDPVDGDWEDISLAVGGAMALSCEDSGYLNVRHAVASEVERSVTHFRSSGEHGDGVDLHLDLKIGHGSAAPDDPGRGDVVLTAVEHDFLDEAPQQRLALSIGGGRVSPDVWETAGEADNLAMQGLADPHVSDGLGRGLLCERCLGLPDLVQSCFPTALEFRGDETIVGIDLVELPFRQSGGVLFPFELTSFLILIALLGALVLARREESD